MKLLSQQYGKARVRVLKVSRQDGRHRLKEVDVSVMFEGAFAAAYTQADNGPVVPTDTMKNTVNALAREHLGEDIENFGAALGQHFLKRYGQVRQATIRLVEHCWEPMTVDGQPHAHSFIEAGRARPFAQVVCGRETTSVESGVEDLLILKSTGSGFAGFPRDEFTTLPETHDRILATNVKAAWAWKPAPQSYFRTNRAILDAMLKVFAATYSPSVQATLFQMGEAALQAEPGISQVHLVMPNQHCLLVNLAPFGLDNKNEIFVPTDEPHGQIEATVVRS
jgi:urate oxidase